MWKSEYEANRKIPRKERLAQLRRASKKYRHSEKGKVVNINDRKIYNRSEKGRKIFAKGQHKWRRSKKGLESLRVRHDRFLNFLANCKTQFGCCYCKEDDFRCLLFHHIVPSEKLVGVGSMWHWGEEKVMAEIAKCEVLCANCHAKETYESGVRQGRPMKESVMNKLKEMKVVEKSWGREIWFGEVEGKYLGKVLIIFAGHSTSFHVHDKKEETLYVQEGTLHYHYNIGYGSYLKFGAGTRVHILPGTPHALKATKETQVILFEVSTDFPEDSRRVEAVKDKEM